MVLSDIGILYLSPHVLVIYQRFLKNHNALDVNNRSNSDILHGYTVDSDGKFSLQVVENNNSFFPKSYYL